MAVGPLRLDGAQLVGSPVRASLNAGAASASARAASL